MSSTVADTLLDGVVGIVAHLKAVGDLVPDAIGHELVVGILEDIADLAGDFACAEIGDILAFEPDRRREAAR